ncbi:phosphotransferase family protein [Pseudonocardia sp. H11422]|uniref:phosphotransferase family protein n=1 Tax=Pseudonocardia sp. H11422 TaxID=2835866 RepID=UPI0027E33E00|nr:phosphotransferase family protein [Pseudonocardia sp. H11422]
MSAVPHAGRAGATSSGTAPVATDPPGLDLTALARYLLRLPDAGAHPAGRLHARLLAGGRSNLTYLVTDDTHRWVLRRPPLGHVLATAHDMNREHRVLTALAGSTVPVPRTVARCDDAEVIGAPFYLMEHVDGVVYRDDDQLAACSPAAAAKIADALVDALVALHTTAPAAVGLSDFGRPVGYLDRQLRRWRTQLDASRSREVPGFDRLGDRLAATTPPQAPSAIVHGDYRLDNVIIDAHDPARVLAVLDWEMSTLGDPLSDLAATVMFWDGVSGLETVITATPGDHRAFPRRARLLDRYAAGTGADLGALPWYLGFAHYKLAVICEGIHYRHTRGETVGAGFDRIGGLVPHLIERGHACLED